MQFKFIFVWACALPAIVAQVPWVVTVLEPPGGPLLQPGLIADDPRIALPLPALSWSPVAVQVALPADLARTTLFCVDTALSSVQLVSSPSTALAGGTQLPFRQSTAVTVRDDGWVALSFSFANVSIRGLPGGSQQKFFCHYYCYLLLGRRFFPLHFQI